MARTSEQNAALRTSARESIERSAVRVFARRGYAASSIRDIADEARLSVGSVYRHYPSKKALHDELLDQAAAGLLQASASLEVGADPLAMVSEFTRIFLADLANGEGEAEFFLIVNQAYLTDTPTGAADRLDQPRRALWNTFAEVVRRGQASGQFAAGDPARLTAWYFSMLAGIAGMRQVLDGLMDAEGVRLMMRLLVRREES